MRFVWTDAGDDPSWDVGNKHGINGYYAPLFDHLTPTVLDEAGKRGHVQGVYFGHDWMPGASEGEIAARVSREYDALRGDQRKLRVMFNLEEHDPDFVAGVLEEWRKLKPKVNTSWSPEGMQGGWMHVDFVTRVLTCRVRVVPQCFTGDMTRRESDIVKMDVVRRGFPEGVVSCMYPATDLGLDWDGFVFRMGLLT